MCFTMNNPPLPRTVEDVINDFKGRRLGIIKALTKDVDFFYKLCDPNHPNLCLYGFPNQKWEVNLPPASDLPEPRLGINFVRDTMSKPEWLAMVAVHSDAWLYSTASYFANKFSFDKADKKRLFNKITDVASIWEVLEGKVNKRPKLESGGLPDHILVEGVFSRLPVRELLKCRSVCRMWLALIDDPGFVSIHLEKYMKNYEGSNLLVLYRSPRNWFGDEQVFVRRGDTYRKVMKLENNTFANYELIAYVNGVILFKGDSRFSREIVLWNPSINKTFNVPPSSIFDAMKDAMSSFDLGLGYDASKNDYKVVAIVPPNTFKKFGGLVQVYTLSTNSWSSNLGASLPPIWSSGKQVYVNGAIHWFNCGPDVTVDTMRKKKDSYVASFDLKNKVFKYFALPSAMINYYSEPYEKFPTVFQESLAIFYAHHDKSTIDIWVMNEYGVSDSWSKRYTFTLQYDNLLHFRSNGELLFALDGKGIKSYDVKRGKTKDLAKTYSRNAKYTVFTYIESLVLSKQGTKRP